MIVSFGCNVPGVMAARTIEQPRERLLTILVAPFMSCSARLPVYALFGAAFFSAHQSLVVFSLYVMGIVIALIVTKILSMTILKMKLPYFSLSYQPTMYHNLKHFGVPLGKKGKDFSAKLVLLSLQAPLLFGFFLILDHMVLMSIWMTAFSNYWGRFWCAVYPSWLWNMASRCIPYCWVPGKRSNCFDNGDYLWRK